MPRDQLKYDLTGQKFGRLTVVERVKNEDKQVAWLCRCTCGNFRVAKSCNLTVGKSWHCGCAKHLARIYANWTHGQRRTPEYQSWAAMKSRCNDSNRREYKWYGARGIKVCERWNAFENFRDDMGPRPVGTTLERLDSNGNYELTNCKWGTWAEQVASRRPRGPNVKPSPRRRA